MTLKAKKSLGQHFLTSKNVLNKIIASANIQENEWVLEIGPGMGVLTQELLKTKAKVVAIEKDSRAVELLKEKFSSQTVSGELRLIEGDILEIKADNFGLEEGNYAVVANIPYYITGAILEKFLANRPQPNRMIILTQKEVADRIVARDGKESILSMSVKAFGQPRIIDTVPRGAFNPPPNVDSAILAIENINQKIFIEQNIGIKRFFDIVKAGFAHKRKFLARNLESIAPIEKVKMVFDSIALDQKTRAEDIKLSIWFDIAKKL